MVNADVLARLQRAREPKVKKAPPTSKERADKRKAEEAADKAAGIKPEKKVASKKFGGRSEKMKGIMAAIQPLYRSFLKEKPVCEIKSQVCTSAASCVHHTAGRGMDHLMDTNTWEASCNSCNLYVEENDKWARENGHKISRHAKPS